MRLTKASRETVKCKISQKGVYNNKGYYLSYARYNAGCTLVYNPQNNPLKEILFYSFHR